MNNETVLINQMKMLTKFIVQKVNKVYHVLLSVCSYSNTIYAKPD